MKKMRRWTPIRSDQSLRRNLMTVSFIVILIAFVTYTVVSIIGYIQLGKDDLFKAQSSNLDLIANDITINLSLLEGEIDSIGQFWLSDDTTLSSLQTMLLVKSAGNPILESIWLMDAAGQEIARADSTGIIPEDELRDDSEWEFFFKAARLPTEATYFSSTRVSGNEMLLTLSRPLYQDEDFRGVIAASIRLNSFHEILSIVSESGDAQIHLLDADGRLLATSFPDAEPHLSSYTAIPPVLDATMGRVQDEVSIYKNFLSGKTVFGTAVRIEKTGWIVVIEHDRAAIYRQQMDVQKYNVLLTFFIVILASVTITLVSRALTDPLEVILEKTQRMRQGELSEKIKPVGSKEMVALAESFNAMSLQLDESMRGLESRIRLQGETEAILRQRSRELEMLLEVTGVLARTHDLSAQMEFAASTCLNLLDADECCLVHLTASRNHYATITRNLARPLENITRHISEMFIRATVPAIFNDLQEKEEIKALLGDDDSALHLISAPLFVAENQIGELLLVRVGGQPFKQGHLNLLMGMAQQTALAIDSLRMVEVLENYNLSLEKAVAKRTSELRTANEDLRKLSQLKDDFISNVSHELRTPLTNLKLRNYLITQQPETVGKHITVLERETERLQAIVENLLMISSLEQSRVETHFEAIDLNDLLGELASDRETLIQAQGKSFTLDLKDDLAAVSADRMLLEQVISILMTNAMNYTPAGGKITLSTCSRELGALRQAGFSITDTGVGITREEQGRLFERFFRGSAAEHTGVPGTGLGLSIAKEIVDRHRGEIEITSSGVTGQGACFTIWLPFLEE